MYKHCDDDDGAGDNDIRFPNPANALASLITVSAIAAVMATQ